MDLYENFHNDYDHVKTGKLLNLHIIGAALLVQKTMHIT